MVDTATNIHDLDPVLPVSGDIAGFGDNEIRQLKTAIQGSIQGSEGAHDWAGEPPWDSAEDDFYDTVPLRLGPRAINALPNLLIAMDLRDDSLQSQIDALDTRLDAAETFEAGVPVGGIIPYYGLLASLTSKWHVCDGTFGTPDLRGMMVMGVGTGFTYNSTGGGASKSTGNAGAHDHGGNTGEVTLTKEQMPQHGHPWVHNSYNSSGGIQSTVGGSIVTTDTGTTDTHNYEGVPSGAHGQQIGGVAGGGLPHKHTIAFAGDHQHTVDVLPPYRALYWIMRVA